MEDNAGSGSVFYFLAKFGLEEEGRRMKKKKKETIKGTCPYGGTPIENVDGLERCCRL